MTWFVAVAASSPFAAWLFAQEQPLDVGSLLRTFGVAAPLVVFALWVNRQETKRAEKWEGIALALYDRNANDVVPLLADVQRYNAERDEVLRDAVRVLQDAQGRPALDPVLVTRIADRLEGLLRNEGGR